MLFYGPSGAGKKTRIMALLRAIFGPSVQKIKMEHRTFKTPTNATVEISMMGSNYHTELNPADVGNTRDAEKRPLARAATSDSCGGATTVHA